MIERQIGPVHLQRQERSRVGHLVLREPGLAERAAAVLGIREGPTSTRIRITTRGPQVIELAARLGSPAEVELARAATGVDLNALALKGALGEPIELDELLRRPQAA